jgi:hypothetical protein
MYCPGCGAQATNGLKFCKQCGAGLGPGPAFSASEPGITVSKLLPFFLAVSGVCGIGLFGLFLVLSRIIRMGMPRGATIPIIMAVSVFGSLTIIVVVSLLVRQLSRLISILQDADSSAQANRPVAGEYLPVQFNTAPVCLPSVTEHTTRNFEPVLRRRRDE